MPDLSESHYVETHCTGQVEYVLPDRTRVDCLTETHAIEFDWCDNWAEAIGQSLYYAAMTGREPQITLICHRDEQRFIGRTKKAAPNITTKVIYIE